jgi:hypothetical protein
MIRLARDLEDADELTCRAFASLQRNALAWTLRESL